MLIKPMLLSYNEIAIARRPFGVGMTDPDVSGVNKSR
jgi:hypothetical protein